ncbi:hypothetical protein BBG47_19835 [Paenibacillus sp. KS1]|uniref:hypothetical protein n=1 Tax=Paenibacillus sp. KS1 TaxID=1849249 RepID=UPI0008064D4A|nr:hypothetical protein [Paenibacillus sp. KS1]OBY77808.1 hypothetical protein BBG47_19835 [Paenibacillus sp. KS1]
MALVTMKQAEFDALSDERLGWACVESTLLGIRGKDAAAKTQVIANLNRSQQALCMFRVFYDHAKNSASEYYSWVAYLLQMPGYWAGVVGGLRFFDDQSMMQLLEETKQIIEERNSRLHIQMEAASFKDLEEDNELSHAVNRLYERFQEMVPASLKRISSFIRTNHQDFVVLEK